MIDTSIWVNAFLADIAEHKQQPYTAILNAWLDGDFVPVFCRESLDELQNVLTGHRLRVRYNIDPSDAKEFIAELKTGRYVDIKGAKMPCSDRGDHMLIEAAVRSPADFLVAEEPHLHEPSVKEFLRNNNVRLVYPSTFVRILADERLEP